MARIRSVHPGLWTDESFVGLSGDAQIFLIGLGTEADDFGLFEWKPVTLRMRLRPTKDGDVTPILSELETAKWLRSYEINGRKYGAIRNFAKWQNPRFPKNSHPFSKEIGVFIGLTPSDAAKAVLEDEPLQRNAEKPSLLLVQSSAEQKSISDESSSSKPKSKNPLNGHKADFQAFYDAYPKHVAIGAARKAYAAALKKGATPEIMLAGAQRYALARAREDPQFTKNPATWLNAESWTDEAAAGAGPKLDPFVARMQELDREH